MKLLLDENLSRRILPFLQESFPGSSQVAVEGLEQATDLQVWEFARMHDYVIVSKDSDFHELSLVKGVPPRVTWIRTGNTTKGSVARMLIQHRERLEYLFAIEAGFPRRTLLRFLRSFPALHHA